jgi:hypothetical protein
VQSKGHTAFAEYEQNFQEIDMLFRSIGSFGKEGTVSGNTGIIFQINSEECLVSNAITAGKKLTCKLTF